MDTPEAGQSDSTDAPIVPAKSNKWLLGMLVAAVAGAGIALAANPDYFSSLVDPPESNLRVTLERPGSGAKDFGVEPPNVGDAAEDFTLQTKTGQSVSLKKTLEAGPVVLVVLRGWPGYHCMMCQKQVGRLIQHADELNDQSAQVLFVFPGPPEGLKDHGSEFATTVELPDSMTLLLDPDYTMTQSYDLRWDATGETAFPSTFVIDQAGQIRFADISFRHGGRTSAEEILEALRDMRNQVGR